MSDEDQNSKVSDTSVIIAVDQDGEAIISSGNPAEYSGILDSVMEWMTESGQHLPIVEQGAVQLSNGALAIDVPTAISFIDGTHDDPCDLKNPAPPTATRIAEYTARTGTAVANVVGIPPALTRAFSVAPYTVKSADAALLKTLSHVIQNADNLAEMKVAAKGSGRRLAIAMMNAHAACLPAERSLVKAKMDSVIKKGVQGELTAKSLASFLKDYKKAKLCVEAPLRPDAASELAMMNLIAYQDPGVREAYELRALVAAPPDFEAAKTMILSILRGRVTMEQIDQVKSGADQAALAAKAAEKAAESEAAATAANIAAVALKTAQAALAAAQAPPDPNKNRRPRGGGRGNGKGRSSRGRGGGDKAPEKEKPPDKAADKTPEKVKPPRDESGRITHWIKGMDLCTCGKEHLFRDCPDAKEAQVVELEAGEQPQECAPEGDAAIIASDLHAFFDTAEPAQPGGHMGLAVDRPASGRSKVRVSKKCIISYNSTSL